MYDQLRDAAADVKTILRYLIVNQFKENQYTKLDQAGSSSDVRPGIHELFIDLPFHIPEYDRNGLVTEYLVRASSRCHRPAATGHNGGSWREWNRQPERARVWILKAGPGQGKSTIGQYFSQIHRAALIVDFNDHPVSETHRALAQAVRDSALAAGFWPCVPRIPVMIELKDFAKWFGERAKNEARGILTYFSEKIEQAVEQPVRAATLKRALGERGWLIVFDGLDEVPNDVKDAVAAEVRTFVDEVIIEVNGDILTLCTSRPQGYSGQFSDMDGPVVNLISLPPDVALQCAKPVLTFNRSGEEAQKSLEVLKAAIASPSVQELMTTPLQAHIMAVVVRDGGRPPERRWQLFSNFYQVMRKREALKGFPNPRVAKLLREDEQLLKAIHARVGFLLHARAETSQGAQTRLDRGEFRSLAIQTVSHFHEENVTAIVDALMEATTERLVLVSTPESGEHVRFDIRQLQEFFAAEFLYDGITADDLRPRIEIVAGDAHWREVMHFLLSALIENKRTTELSVAINVLDQLNDREEGSAARMFYKRMGRGALLASRLLQEGVLEQDKRVRQLFRSVLEPITGMLENEKLMSLASGNQINSKAWLVNFMVDILLEADFSESVGASIVLAQILPDDHPRTPEVKKRYLSASKAYQEFVISSIAPEPYRGRLHPALASIFQEWFLEAVLELIIRQDWTEFSGPALYACLRVLAVNEERSAGMARKLGWPTSHVQLLLFLLTVDKESEPPTGKPLIDYGVFHAHAFQHDWTTGTFPEGLWSSGTPSDAPGLLEVVFRALRFEPTRSRDDIPRDASDAPGLLQVVFRALRFGRTRSRDALASALDEISRFPDIFMAIPRWVLAFVPINPLSDSIAAQIARLRRLSDSELASAIQQQAIGADKLHRPLVGVFRRGDRCSPAQWIKLTKELPALAVHYWFDDWRFGEPRPTSLDSPAGVSALIQALETRLDLAASYILSWGKLLAAAPACEVQLRGIMLRAVNRTAVNQFFGTRSIHPYQIELGQEREVLPALAAALAERLSRFDGHFIFGADEKRQTAAGGQCSGSRLDPVPAGGGTWQRWSRGTHSTTCRSLSAHH